MVFFAAVVVPTIRRPEMRPSAPILMRFVGPRFRVLGWAALGVLGITGVLNLYFRGITWSMLVDGGFWSAGFGRILGYKLVLVAVVVVMALAHEWVASGSGEAQARRASWLGRVMLVLSLAILFLAVSLVRGFFG
jgi:putative copper export protein